MLFSASWRMRRSSFSTGTARWSSPVVVVTSMSRREGSGRSPRRRCSRRRIGRDGRSERPRSRGTRRSPSGRRRGAGSPRLFVLAGETFDLEADVGQPLTDPVVEVPGDAAAFLLGAERSQAAEPAGVVDRQGDDVSQAGDETLVRLGQRCDSSRSPGLRRCGLVCEGRVDPDAEVGRPARSVGRSGGRRVLQGRGRAAGAGCAVVGLTAQPS